MKLKEVKTKNLYKYIISYFILWVLLFEFILPANYILPKPSVVIMSFSALWQLYKLPYNYITTLSAVYISIIISYFLISALSGFIVKKNHFLYQFLESLHWFGAYVPAIVFGLFFIYWLPGSTWAEFIFAFLVSFFSIVIKAKEEASKVSRVYIDSALSLGISEKTIAKNVIWKSVQPEIIRHLVKLQFNLWSVLLAFEFLKSGYGLGRILRLSLEYKDLSALFTVALITGITIFAGTKLIKYIENKFYHWSVD